MLSSCCFLNRGGRKEGKQNLSKKSQTPHWRWQQLLSEDRLRLEGLCFILPLVFPQEAASNPPEATDYKPGHSCSTQCDQTSGMKKVNSQYYNTSHSSQKDHSTAPAKISAFHCPKIITDLRDSGSHWSWDVKRVPWVHNCPPERSKVKLSFFSMKYVFVHGESLQDKGKDNAHAVYGTSQWELLGYMWLVNKEDFSYSITFPFASQISSLKFLRSNQ